MNKKLLLIGVALFLLLLVVWLIFSRNGGIGGSKLSKPPAKNEESIEKRLDWLQSNIAVSVFTTREDPEGTLVEDKQMAHIAFTSFFTVTVNDGQKIKTIEIVPVSFTQKIGTQVAIQPSHEKTADNSRSFILTSQPSIKAADIGKSVSKITLKGTTNSSLTEGYFDEIYQNGGFVNFALITKSIGQVSTQAILERDKVYESGKVLEYLGIKAEDLDGSIVLDVTVTFEDGKKYIKRFSGTIEGNKILSESFYQITMTPQ